MNAAEHSEKRWLSAVREVDHLFARFGRYTRFVFYGKWSLLAIALLLVISLIAWPLVTKDRSGLRVSFVDSKTAGQKAASPVMNNPEYRGTGINGQEYKINGKKATQATSSLIIIDQVEAQMLKADGKWYSLTAKRAEYQQDKNLIDLFGDVNVIDARATNFTTEHATIETQTMHIYGSDPITGVGDMGNIVASGFEITDNGNRIIFKGGAKQLKVTIDKSGKQR